MLPVLYYAVLIPFVFYGLPATIIYLLTVKLFVPHLQASPQKVFLNSRTGKLLIALGSLALVLLGWGIRVLLTAN